MTRHYRRSLLLAASLLLALGTGALGRPAAEHILDEALQKRAAIDTLRRFTLTLRTANGRSQTQRASVATKEYEGELYVLGVFSHPQELRGTAFLTIDRNDSADHFVYFPAFDRVRRVSAYQKSDPWFGTDLAIEDVERRRAHEYEILKSGRSDALAEPAIEIVARPLYGSRYDRIHFMIANRDHVILRTEYYTAGREAPSKLIVADREGLIDRNGAAVPKRLHCTNLESNTETEVILEEVVFAPDLQQEFFSTRSLELRSKLKFLE